MKKLIVRFPIVFLLGFLLSSCATLFLGTSQKVKVYSNPPGATVYVNGKSLDKQTPCQIKISRRNPKSSINKSNEVVYTFKKQGYADAEYRNFSRVNGLIYIDYFFTLFPGIIDNFTKGHRVYDKQVAVKMFPLTQSDNSGPKISISYPNVSRGFKSVEQNPQIIIKGNVNDESGVAEVLINNEKVPVSANGDFAKIVSLTSGDNTFVVKASDTKNNTSSETFVVQRPDNTAGNRTNQPSRSTQTFKLTGKYYALIIGNNDYQDRSITALNEPIKDATKLYDVLTTKYTFDTRDVTFLKNATYEQMIQAFDDLSNKITAEDNIIVFYAGHGWWDEVKNLGYWLPTDAKKNNTAFWIPNSRISDYMKSIKSRHTLLIADACFSGSIFKTRSAFSDAQPAINKLYEIPSKKAMTSGNLKEVPDKSVFLQYLVQRLNENAEKYVSSDNLFASFRQAVLNNSPTEPQYGTIQNAGDEGGEFIFIHK